MEHLLYCCEHYSAKVWDLTGKSLTLALSHHSGEYIPAVVLTSYPSGNSFQQTTSLHIITCPGCHHTEGINSTISRDQTRYYLQTCTTTRALPSWRITSKDSSPSCLGHQQDYIAARISRNGLILGRSLFSEEVVTNRTSGMKFLLTFYYSLIHPTPLSLSSHYPTPSLCWFGWYIKNKTQKKSTPN
jgi:hypothetical protein